MDWLVAELEKGLSELEPLLEDEDLFWRRYWVGYQTAYKSLLEKASARTALENTNGQG